MGRRGDEQIGQVDGHKRIGLAGGQFHRQVIDFSGTAQGRHARCRNAHLAGIKMNRVFVQHLAHVPDDRIGIQGRAIVELHAWTQLEGPFGFVGCPHRPRGGQSRADPAGCIGFGQVPVGQGVVHRDTGEPVAFKALVRLPQGAGNVGCRHGNAQDFFLRLNGHGDGAEPHPDSHGERPGCGQTRGKDRPLHHQDSSKSALKKCAPDLGNQQIGPVS